MVKSVTPPPPPQAAKDVVGVGNAVAANGFTSVLINSTAVSSDYSKFTTDLKTSTTAQQRQQDLLTLAKDFSAAAPGTSFQAFGTELTAALNQEAQAGSLPAAAVGAVQEFLNDTIAGDASTNGGSAPLSEHYTSIGNTDPTNLGNI